jgi:cytochrome c
MKSILIAAALAAGISATGVASADGGEDVAKKSGCLNCHAVDTKKVGPAYKDVAKKFKGKSSADVVAAMKANPIHASVKVPDNDLKEIAEWIQKL